MAQLVPTPSPPLGGVMAFSRRFAASSGPDHAEPAHPPDSQPQKVPLLNLPPSAVPSFAPGATSRSPPQRPIGSPGAAAQTARLPPEPPRDDATGREESFDAAFGDNIIKLHPMQLPIDSAIDPLAARAGNKCGASPARRCLEPLKGPGLITSEQTLPQPQHTKHTSNHGSHIINSVKLSSLSPLNERDRNNISFNNNSNNNNNDNINNHKNRNSTTGMGPSAANSNHKRNNDYISLSNAPNIVRKPPGNGRLGGTNDCFSSTNHSLLSTRDMSGTNNNNALSENASALDHAASCSLNVGLGALVDINSHHRRNPRNGALSSPNPPRLQAALGPPDEAYQDKHPNNLTLPSAITSAGSALSITNNSLNELSALGTGRFEALVPIGRQAHLENRPSLPYHLAAGSEMGYVSLDLAVLPPQLEGIIPKNPVNAKQRKQKNNKKSDQAASDKARRHAEISEEGAGLTLAVRGCNYRDARSDTGADSSHQGSPNISVEEDTSKSAHDRITRADEAGKTSIDQGDKNTSNRCKRQGLPHAAPTGGLGSVAFPKGKETGILEVSETSLSLLRLPQQHKAKKARIADNLPRRNHHVDSSTLHPMATGTKEIEKGPARSSLSLLELSLNDHQEGPVRRPSDNGATAPSKPQRSKPTANGHTASSKAARSQVPPATGGPAQTTEPAPDHHHNDRDGDEYSRYTIGNETSVRRSWDFIKVPHLGGPTKSSKGEAEGGMASSTNMAAATGSITAKARSFIRGPIPQGRQAASNTTSSKNTITTSNAQKGHTGSSIPGHKSNNNAKPARQAQAEGRKLSTGLQENVLPLQLSKNIRYRRKSGHPAMRGNGSIIVESATDNTHGSSISTNNNSTKNHRSAAADASASKGGKGSPFLRGATRVTKAIFNNNNSNNNNNNNNNNNGNNNNSNNNGNTTINHVPHTKASYQVEGQAKSSPSSTITENKLAALANLRRMVALFFGSDLVDGARAPDEKSCGTDYKDRDSPLGPPPGSNDGAVAAVANGNGAPAASRGVGSRSRRANIISKSVATAKGLRIRTTIRGSPPRFTRAPDDDAQDMAMEINPTVTKLSVRATALAEAALVTHSLISIVQAYVRSRRSLALVVARRDPTSLAQCARPKPLSAETLSVGKPDAAINAKATSTIKSLGGMTTHSGPLADKALPKASVKRLNAFRGCAVPSPSVQPISFKLLAEPTTPPSGALVTPISSPTDILQKDNLKTPENSKRPYAGIASSSHSNFGLAKMKNLNNSNNSAILSQSRPVTHSHSDLGAAANSSSSGYLYRGSQTPISPQRGLLYQSSNSLSVSTSPKMPQRPPGFIRSAGNGIARGSQPGHSRDNKVASRQRDVKASHKANQVTVLSLSPRKNDETSKPIHSNPGNADVSFSELSKEQGIKDKRPASNSGIIDKSAEHNSEEALTSQQVGPLGMPQSDSYTAEALTLDSTTIARLRHLYFAYYDCDTYVLDSPERRNHRKKKKKGTHDRHEAASAEINTNAEHSDSAVEPRRSSSADTSSRDTNTSVPSSGTDESDEDRPEEGCKKLVVPPSTIYNVIDEVNVLSENYKEDMARQEAYETEMLLRECSAEAELGTVDSAVCALDGDERHQYSRSADDSDGVLVADPGLVVYGRYIPGLIRDADEVRAMLAEQPRAPSGGSFADYPNQSIGSSSSSSIYSSGTDSDEYHCSLCSDQSEAGDPGSPLPPKFCSSKCKREFGPTSQTKPLTINNYVKPFGEGTGQPPCHIKDDDNNGSKWRCHGCRKLFYLATKRKLYLSDAKSEEKLKRRRHRRSNRSGDVAVVDLVHKEDSPAGNNDNYAHHNCITNNGLVIVYDEVTILDPLKKKKIKRSHESKPNDQGTNPKDNACTPLFSQKGVCVDDNGAGKSTADTSCYVQPRHHLVPAAAVSVGADYPSGCDPNHNAGMGDQIPITVFDSRVPPPDSLLFNQAREQRCIYSATSSDCELLRAEERKRRALWAAKRRQAKQQLQLQNP